MSLDRFDASLIAKLILSQRPDSETLRQNTGDFTNLVKRKSEFEECTENLEVVKGQSLGKLSLPIFQIDLLKDILRGLADEKIQASLVEYNKDCCSDIKCSLLRALGKTNILPAIHYVICDSLLTGGLGCGQPNIVLEDKSGREATSPAELTAELLLCIKESGLTWENLFTMPHSDTVLLKKEFYTMAMEQDNPDILLAALGKHKFEKADIDEPRIRESTTTPTKSIAEHIQEEKRENITKKIAYDLDAIDRLSPYIDQLAKINQTSSSLNNFVEIATAMKKNREEKTDNPAYSFFPVTLMLINEFKYQRQEINKTDNRNIAEIINSQSDKYPNLCILAKALQSVLKEYPALLSSEIDDTMKKQILAIHSEHINAKPTTSSLESEEKKSLTKLTIDRQQLCSLFMIKLHEVFGKYETNNKEKIQILHHLEEVCNKLKNDNRVNSYEALRILCGGVKHEVESAHAIQKTLQKKSLAGFFRNRYSEFEKTIDETQNKLFAHLIDNKYANVNELIKLAGENVNEDYMRYTGINLHSTPSSR